VYEIKNRFGYASYKWPEIKNIIILNPGHIVPNREKRLNNAFYKLL
jgi:hypothetical protein